MEIRNPGFIPPPVAETSNVQPPSAVRGRFAASAANAGVRAGHSAAPLLPGVQAGFTRKDLQDPGRGEAAIRQALDEMLEKEFPQAEHLEPAGRAQLVDWMSRDPVISNRMRGLLERTLE